MRLDGGTATELERAGLTLTTPWWTTAALLSGERRRTLRDVHAAYLTAGADVVTANTFRCNLRAMRAAGLDALAARTTVWAAVWVARAARDAAGDGRGLVAGSMAPVEDCYRPELVPPNDELRAEHRWLAGELVGAGVDVVLVETMNTRREARIALAEVLAAGGRAWVAFACADGARLLSGEPVAGAARAVEADGADAVLVNCTPVAVTERCLRVLREACRGPIGAYPNVEDRTGCWRPGTGGAWPVAVGPEELAGTLRHWHDDLDATLLGGCCGTGPEHIAALVERLGPLAASPAPTTGAMFSSTNGKRRAGGAG